MYLASVKRYTKDETDILAQMLGYVIMALEENHEQDFLGEMFSGLNLYNEWKDSSSLRTTSVLLWRQSILSTQKKNLSRRIILR